MEFLKQQVYQEFYEVFCTNHVIISIRYLIEFSYKYFFILGHFGRVYRALYRKPGEKGEMCVAVKTLHSKLCHMMIFYKLFEKFIIT